MLLGHLQSRVNATLCFVRITKQAIKKNLAVYPAVGGQGALQNGL